MSTNPKGLFQNGKDSEMNLCSDVENSKRIVLQFKETGLHLGYHLDPVQGPAGCRHREVSPLPGACSPPYFTVNCGTQTADSELFIHLAPLSPIPVESVPPAKPDRARRDEPGRR